MQAEYISYVIIDRVEKVFYSLHYDFEMMETLIIYWRFLKNWLKPVIIYYILSRHYILVGC